MAFTRTYVKIDKDDYMKLKEDADDVILASDLHQLNLYQGQRDDMQSGWEQKVFNVPEVHRAAFYGDIQKLKILLKQKKNANLQIIDGPKVLQYKENSEVLTIGYFLGTTPLMIASSRGHIRAVKLLVSRGAQVNVTDSVGMTAFAWACTTNKLVVCNFLLKNYALIDEREDRYGMSPLLIASRQNLTDAVRLLVKRGANVHSQNSKGQTAMHFAAWNYNIEIMKLLCSKGLSVNVKDNNGCTPLHLLVSDDNFDEPHSEEHSNMSNLESLKLVKLFDELQKHENNGVHVLVDIARTVTRGTGSSMTCEEYFALKTLVNLGADLNHKDSSGNTAFHVLAFRLPLATISRGYVISEEPVLNQVTLVQMAMLVKMGANINSPNIHGQTPIELCEQLGKWVAVKILGKYTDPKKVFVEDWDSLDGELWKSGMKYCERINELENAVESMSDTVLEHNNVMLSALGFMRRMSRYMLVSLRTCIINMWE